MDGIISLYDAVADFVLRARVSLSDIVLLSLCSIFTSITTRCRNCKSSTQISKHVISSNIEPQSGRENITSRPNDTTTVSKAPNKLNTTPALVSRLKSLGDFSAVLFATPEIWSKVDRADLMLTGLKITDFTTFILCGSPCIGMIYHDFPFFDTVSSFAVVPSKHDLACFLCLNKMVSQRLSLDGSLPSRKMEGTSKVNASVKTPASSPVRKNERTMGYPAQQGKDGYTFFPDRVRNPELLGIDSTVWNGLTTPEKEKFLRNKLVKNQNMMSVDPSSETAKLHLQLTGVPHPKVASNLDIASNIERPKQQTYIDNYFGGNRKGSTQLGFGF